MKRKGEFLISLLTGSINNIDKTGLDYPETILEKIKEKLYFLTEIRQGLFTMSQKKKES